LPVYQFREHDEPCRTFSQKPSKPYDPALPFG
jgi:hypothetical protein